MHARRYPPQNTLPNSTCVWKRRFSIDTKESENRHKRLSTYRGNGERRRRKREKGLNKKRAATAYQRQSSLILAATASFREIKTLKKATETRK